MMMFFVFFLLVFNVVNVVVVVVVVIYVVVFVIFTLKMTPLGIFFSTQYFHSYKFVDASIVSQFY